MKPGSKPSTAPLAFRFPKPLIARLDAYAERLAQEAGVAVSRSGVVKKLLGIGLDHVERAASKRKK
jgi:hypothetical protein